MTDLEELQMKRWRELVKRFRNPEKPKDSIGHPLERDKK